jgi:hypothetical protein
MIKSRTSQPCVGPLPQKIRDIQAGVFTRFCPLLAFVTNGFARERLTRHFAICRVTLRRWLTTLTQISISFWVGDHGLFDRSPARRARVSSGIPAVAPGLTSAVTIADKIPTQADQLVERAVAHEQRGNLREERT